MNKTLTALLACAAVVGASSGTVAAARVLGPSTDPAATPGSAPRTASAPADPSSGSSSSGSSGSAGSTGGVLWANQRSLHDGDTTVRLDLTSPPAAVQRVAGGWVVSVMSSPQEPSFEVDVVHPDGTTMVLADTFEHGDVSPDGTQYVAMAQEGGSVKVWDVATGKVVHTITDGALTGQYPVGGASFGKDADTVYAGWSGQHGATDIVRTSLATGTSEVVDDDVAGEWNVSADGGVLAGTSADASDPEAGYQQCAVVKTTRAADEGVTDCGTLFANVPSFSPNGGSVLAEPAGGDGFGPSSFRVLDTGGNPPHDYPSPGHALSAAFLDDDHFAVLGAKNLNGDGTVVSVCATVGGPCRQVATSGDAAGTAVLGTSS